jgi:hypothetical protein
MATNPRLLAQQERKAAAQAASSQGQTIYADPTTSATRNIVSSSLGSSPSSTTKSTSTIPAPIGAPIPTSNPAVTGNTYGDKTNVAFNQANNIQPPQNYTVASAPNIQPGYTRPVEQPPNTVADDNPQMKAMTNLLEQLLNDRQQQRDYAANYNNYMNNYQPLQSREQFVNQANSVAQANAKLQYDAIADNLRTRVANVIFDLQNRRSGLEGQYRPMYQQNDQNAYQSRKNIASQLIRSGMGDSGVALGAGQQADLNYAMQRQNIDLQRQAEEQNIANDLTKTNQTLENDLTSIDRERANYLAAQATQAERDYQNYLMQEREFASNNYWKGAGMDQNADLANQQFGLNLYNTMSNRVDSDRNYQLSEERLNLERQTIENSKKQFYETLKRSDERFAFEMQEADRKNIEWWASFNEDKAYKQKLFDREILETNRQYELAYADQEFRHQEAVANRIASMNAAKQANALGWAQQNLNQEKWKLTKQQMEKELSGEYQYSTPEYQQFITEVNKEMFGYMQAIQDDVTNGKIDKATGYKQITSFINTSPVDKKFKLAMQNAADDAFDITGLETELAQPSVQEKIMKYYESGKNVIGNLFNSMKGSTSQTLDSAGKNIESKMNTNAYNNQLYNQNGTVPSPTDYLFGAINQRLGR